VFPYLARPPRSVFIKCLPLFLGVAWLAAAAFFRVQPASGWRVLLGRAVASLWYLPTGTFTGIVVIALLLNPRVRS
jgi:hypothetical protein